MPREMRDDCPSMGEIFHPMLVLASEGEIQRVDAAKRLAEIFNLTERAQKELTPKARENRWQKNVDFAKTHLSRAGLITSPRRGHVVATDAGKKFLEKHKDGFTSSELNKLADVPKTKAKTEVQAEEDETSIGEFSPEKLIDRAEIAINAKLEADLLEKVIKAPPAFLEKLVVKLLEAMGYGTGESLGGSGDGGVDGVIYQDELKFGKIYIQAKRYGSQSVGPALIREFIGTIVKGGTDKGIFITTSSFTSAARDEADDPRFNIVLIDGNRLAKLMVEYNIGCAVESTIQIMKIDSNYFSSNK